MTVEAFARAFLDRGVEFTVSLNGRLQLWPPKAYSYLTNEERAFIREHRAELRALAASKALPETTVTWNPNGVIAPVSAPAAEITRPSAPPCPYCGASPCVGPEHEAYPALHFLDPVEAKRRAEYHTAVARKMIPLWDSQDEL